ncbi:MAG: hypothetical protein MI724_03625 [Spirochaetales bacterium]|nr:hypothetical protein [Spirochaetales bacterium]
MSQNTPIYGHSRGYRLLALFSVVAVAVSVFAFDVGFDPVAIAGTIGFAALFLYSWRRSARRIVVLNIEDDGFAVLDPAQPLGLITFEEIEEIRIYALLEHPTIGFRLTDPDRIRRRGPAVLRVLNKPFWTIRHYQVVVQLDNLNDQVAAIRSTAARCGIPVRSELL